MMLTAISRARLGAVAVLLATTVACTSRVELLSALPENDANEILSTLLNAGINAEKRSNKEGFTVNVDPSQVASAMSALHAQGLPRDPYVSIGQVFRKDGLISSPLEERARYLYALSQELAFTLTKIDGVLTARVHIVLPERIGKDEAVTPSSAAVFIKYRDDVAVDTLQPQLRKLVSNSIPGLSADKVSFILVPAAPITRSAPPAARNTSGTSGAMLTLLVGLALLALASTGGLVYVLMGRQWDRLLEALVTRLPLRRAKSASAEAQ
ncbi:EscJ/YscJ/HrcJ family type III secretion inner membrane ring protein [Pandoraea pnomenusa]|uniref:type III secretion system inner membrane ring lipoprotein SctJ n=1 Tax=Pandoraea pnomenusa TaxID=93220 RepID=UPI0011984D09|nr:type III secretion inner membrane ring lipoprotein SctJ [Pandoraea pnomenusa]QDX20577.1 EscJ/YscJ/HrcJ family type III secretion inner membrane ring protein [Pandoraea pnomenusa]